MLDSFVRENQELYILSYRKISALSHLKWLSITKTHYVARYYLIVLFDTTDINYIKIRFYQESTRYLHPIFFMMKEYLLFIFVASFRIIWVSHNKLNLFGKRSWILSGNKWCVIPISFKILLSLRRFIFIGDCIL